MTLYQPSEAELLSAGSLKWTGRRPSNGIPPLGAWVAEMDYGTAPAVQERLVRAVRQNFLGYPTQWASDAVVEALVDFQDHQFGWVLKPGWVRTTQSVLASLNYTIAHLTRPGSAVVVPTPSYMPFLTIPLAHGREIIAVPSIHTPSTVDQMRADERQLDETERAQQGWSLDLEGIENALKDGAGLVILCDPWNPTGRVLSVPELRALGDVVSKYDALVFADEIHSPLILGDPGSFVSYASLGPKHAAHTVTAFAASKGWNLGGLMCGQVILPDADLRQRWDDAGGGPSASGLGSVAAATAYTETEGWLPEVTRQVSANLDLLEDALVGTPVDYHRPQATYLAWLGFDDYVFDEGQSPTSALLEDYGIAVNDGATLGPGFEKWVRVNVAMSDHLWADAVKRIGEFARNQPRK